MAALRESYPPLFRRHARRPRLTRLLDESTAQAILVTGPPGYGKTTLATEWVQGREDVIWYRATPGSADVAAFSAGLADVMAPIVPHAGDRLKQRLRVADSPERAARPLAEILSEDLATWPADGLLIIDDYHLVADSSPVEEFMDWLLTLTPALRVLATSRRRPKWASARRILYGEITEIDTAQLAMTTDEAALVLDGRSTEQVRALVRQAEGWPALIGLAALSATHEIPTERVSDALYRYFAEEVVRGVPPEVERFMLLASVPPVVTEKLAEAVLGVASAEAVIRRLVEEGLLQPSGSAALQFHPLLRAFLNQQLKTRDPELWHQLVEKSVAHFRALEDWERAYELAMSLDNAQAKVEIVEMASSEMLASGQVESLSRWLDECGSAGNRPGAILARAEILIRQGHLAQASALAESVATTLPEDHQLTSRANSVAGHALYLRSRSGEASRFYQQAVTAAETEPDRSEALWGAFLAHADIDLEMAAGFLADLESRASDDLNTRLRVAVARQTIASLQGSFRGLWSAVEALLPLAAHATDSLASSNFLAQASYLAVARSDYRRGSGLADQALELTTGLGHEFGTAFCLANRAAANVGLRKVAAARSDLHTIAQMSVHEEDPYIRTQRALVEARAAIAEGNLIAARVHVETDFAGLPDARTQGERLALLGLIEAALGRPEVALRRIPAARTTTEATEARFLCSFIEAIVEEWVPDRIHRLFNECVDAEYTDSFVVAYRAHPPILSGLASLRPAPQQVLNVLRRANDRSLALKSGFELRRGDFTKTGDVLTAREQEVLDLVALGMSNDEIAKRLFIARSTVKVHVRRVLEKLGAKNRVQAALMAEKKL